MVDRIAFDLRIRLYDKKDADLVSVYLYCNGHNISFCDLCRSVLHRYLGGNIVPIKVPGMSPLLHDKQSYILNIGLYAQTDQKIIEFIRTISKNNVNTVIKQILKYYFSLQTLIVFQNNFKTFSEEELTERIQDSHFEFVETHQKNYKIKRSEQRVPKRAPVVPSSPELLRLDGIDGSSKELPKENVSVSVPKTASAAPAAPAFAIDFGPEEDDDDTGLEEIEPTNTAPVTPFNFDEPEDNKVVGLEEMEPSSASGAPVLNFDDPADEEEAVLEEIIEEPESETSNTEEDDGGEDDDEYDEEESRINALNQFTNAFNNM